MSAIEDIQNKWEAYTEAWSNVNDAKREELTKLCLAEDVSYSNTQIEGTGRSGLVAAMVDFQKQFPNSHFELEKTTIHHDQLLGAWTLIAQDGSKILVGHNYFRVGGVEGKIVHMTGFF
jgi:hypothetical protein